MDTAQTYVHIKYTVESQDPGYMLCSTMYDVSEGDIVAQIECTACGMLRSQAPSDRTA